VSSGSGSLRIVSLVPSVTETLLAWGIDPVAVTRFCEQPDHEAVGGTKDPDLGRIVELAPDLVVLCREENRREDAEAMAAAGMRIHVVDVRTVAGVALELAALAGAVGLDFGELRVTGLLGEVDPPPGEPVVERHAFVPIWRKPWMSLADDTYGADLLRALGVRSVTADHPDRYPTVTLEEMATAQPDLVVAPTEPYPFAERHRAELETVAPVTFVDGADLFWWGIRTPAAIRRLGTQLSTG
jgi:ABC-type Fe3+-hydroxamate transport system substrate-binding protein